MIKNLNINESFICKIWEGGKAYYSNLKTTENEPVEIIEFGKRNYDSGPDYSDAKIKIGDKTYSGDVELHRDMTNWEEHNHPKDRKYNKVILQVVMWDGGGSKPKLRIKRNLPTVILSEFLNISIHNIWQEIISHPSEKFTLACSELNSQISENELKGMFDNLANERLKIKSGRIKDRLREIELKSRGAITGEYLRTSSIWKQVLYEFVFEALGYSKNKEPMLKLARSLTLKKINSLSEKIKENSEGLFKKAYSNNIFIQSILFGMGGFFFDLRHKDRYIDKVKSIWATFSTKIKSERLNKTDWSFFRLRPRNFPTVRLAYGSQLISKILDEDLLKKIILIFDSEKFEIKTAYKKLKILFEPGYDEYWSKHYNFGKLSKSTFKLLGSERINDIIINVIIPLTYLYSSLYKKEKMENNVLLFYSSLKISPHNSILNIIEKQVLNRRQIKINSPAMEQASLQLYTFYCTRERCMDCQIGKQVLKDKGYGYKIIFY